MPQETITTQPGEAAARAVLGQRYDIYLHHYSVGRLTIKMALADSGGDRRQADALFHLIQRKQREGRV